jgi:hypothetical protein
MGQHQEEGKKTRLSFHIYSTSIDCVFASTRGKKKESGWRWLAAGIYLVVYCAFFRSHSSGSGGGGGTRCVGNVSICIMSRIY